MEPINKNSISLTRIIGQQGIRGLKNISQQIAEGTIILDCTDVVNLEPQQKDALFSQIPDRWRREQEFHNFIDMTTLDCNLRGELIEYVRDNRYPENTNKKSIFIVIGVVALFAVFAGLFTSNKNPTALTTPVSTQPSPTSPKPSNLEAAKITIGVLGKSDRYAELKKYLQQKFGDRVQIQLAGDETIDYQTLKDKIARKELDIVFTLSPMISIAAKDNGYTWAAKMFANKPDFYQSVFFVKKGSPIRSLKDLKPTTVIALGDFNSASSFYMPSYTLFGKSLTVDRGYRGKQIKDLVKSGKVDIGAAAYPDAIDERDPDFDIIDKSRDIPGSGVYLSPKLSAADRKLIAQVLLEAPESVRDEKNANYGEGNEPDYSQFRQITHRVESILSCVNWEKRSILFSCPGQETGITGKVSGGKPSNSDPQQAHFELKTQNGQTYRVVIPVNIINQIPGAGSLLNINNKHIRIINVQPRKSSDSKQEIKIEEPSQIKLMTDSLVKNNPDVSAKLPSILDRAKINSISQHLIPTSPDIAAKPPSTPKAEVQTSPIPSSTPDRVKIQAKPSPTIVAKSPSTRDRVIIQPTPENSEPEQKSKIDIPQLNNYIDRTVLLEGVKGVSTEEFVSKKGKKLLRFRLVDSRGQSIGGVFNEDDWDESVVEQLNNGSEVNILAKVTTYQGEVALYGKKINP